VNQSPPHSTLREWRMRMTHPAALVVMAGVAAILAVVAPFETGRHLAVVPRLGYWACVVGATFGVGLYVSLTLGPWLEGRLGLWPATLGQGLLTGLAIIPVILGLTWAFFAYVPPSAQVLSLGAQFVVIAVIVTTVIRLASDHVSGAAAGGEPPFPPEPPVPPVPATGPALLARVPLDRRGSLLSLSAEDHYTRVRTTGGEALLLIRLGDAMAQTAPVEGVQIHRSHWVALAAVRAVRRQGDGALVTLQDGTQLPASRRAVPALRMAGLLPKGAS
jgi:hypothetical protein